jgi:hypothetical protein
MTQSSPQEVPAAFSFTKPAANTRLRNCGIIERFLYVNQLNSLNKKRA